MAEAIIISMMPIPPPVDMPKAMALARQAKNS